MYSISAVWSQGTWNYRPKEGDNIPEAFVTEVTPHICEILGEAVAKVLSFSLLWAAVEGRAAAADSQLPMMPAEIADAIKDHLLNHGGSLDQNPIDETLLLVYRVVHQMSTPPSTQIPREDSVQQQERGVVPDNAGLLG